MTLLTRIADDMMVRVVDQAGEVRVLRFAEARRVFRMDEEEVCSLEAGDRVALETVTIELASPIRAYG